MAGAAPGGAGFAAGNDALQPYFDEMFLGRGDVAAMLQSLPDLDAVAICTPPVVRQDAARFALAQGKHVRIRKIDNFDRTASVLCDLIE